MKLLNFTIIRFTFCLIIGIVIAHNFEIDFSVALYTTIVLIIALDAYWLVLRQKINRTPYFAVLAYICMIGLGINTYNIQDEKLQSKHYTNFVSTESFNNIAFKIKERLKPDAYNDKYMVSLLSFNNREASGRLLVNLKRDSLTRVLNIDDVLFTSAVLKEVQSPLNPHQFDYSKYLELKQVYHQLYIEQNELHLISDRRISIYGHADQLRNKINKKLIAAGFKDNALSIINALLLGQRQTIDKTIYNNYVNSGTIHILAVSGLHVGILLLILNFILRPLLYFKYGYILRPAIIIILLWSFAVIAGLSPSVTRAVTMFSVLSFAMHLKRPANIYNTLAISAFFILLFKPNFLFEIGFQMSYLAVLGIVSIQPILYRLWKPKYWIIDKPWQIFTVTVAAQVGVAPISLFYFHQFPGLFFISNLVVIPFLGFILGLGLFIIILALINSLPEPLVTVYSFIIDSLNSFIAWITEFENFLFRDIPFTIIQVISSYFIIVTLLRVYKYKTFKWLVLCFIGIIGLQSTSIYNNFKNKNDTLIIFNKSRYTMIGIKHNGKLEIHHNLDSVKQSNDNVIKNYKVGEMIKMVSIDSLQNVYHYKNKTFLIIDSLGVYKNLSFRPNYILLRSSPKINLNRVIDSLKPDQIIVDASNYKTYVKRWKVTSKHKKIPFHYTNEKGAYIIK